MSTTRAWLWVCGLALFLGVTQAAGAREAASPPARGLPGELGPVRYLASLDDASALWLVDWELKGQHLALIQLTGHGASISGVVIAYARHERGSSPQRSAYWATDGASPLSLVDSGRSTLHEGTVRKRWDVEGLGATLHYVELAAGPGAPRREELASAYLASEGELEPLDAAQAVARIKAMVSSGCGSSPVVTLESTGIAGKAVAAVRGLEELCRHDADYRAAIAKLAELRFIAAANRKLAVVRRGEVLEIGLGAESVNTAASTKRWLEKNL